MDFRVRTARIALCLRDTDMDFEDYEGKEETEAGMYCSPSMPGGWV